MRKIFVIVLCCTAVLLAGYAGFRGYKVWKQSHLISLARDFLAKSDGRNALLCVQQVLSSDPNNMDATKLMAEFADAARSPSAVLWRSRVVELNPRSLDDRLALARTAMMMRDYASATNALEGVDHAGKNTARYHMAAGAVAAAANQTALAETHFLEAAKLEPQNTVAQFNLAVVRLHGTNAPAIAEAQNSLQNLRSNPTNSSLRCQALRELAIDAMRNNQASTALAMSRQLLQETNSVFRDRLLQLEVLQAMRSAEFNSTLVTCQREAAPDPGKTYELAMWQMAKTSPKDTLAWLRTLPSATQTNQAVELLLAECRTTLRDWRGLQAQLEQQNWAELEFVRHAFLSRALRGQELTDSAKAEWEMTMKDVNGQKERLVMLLRLVAKWGWLNEGQEILWIIVKRYPGENWAVQSLAQVLIADGQTRSIMQLYTQEMKRNPSNLPIKNNVAMSALLLDAQELKPHELAKEVYQKSPTNSSFISTYAFSLYLQGKHAEALKVIQTIKPEDLQTPEIAGYYGIILKATGDREKARVYVNWAFKARLLPEEKKLFERAKE